MIIFIYVPSVITNKRQVTNSTVNFKTITKMKKSIFYITLIFIISNYTGKAQKISAGGNHSLFLKVDATVCVTNTSDLDETFVPIHVNSLSGITAISAGNYYSLFLKNDGTVWSIGRNIYGQLGDGTTVSKESLVQVNSLSGITAISASGTFTGKHSLFLKTDGTVWGSGYNEKGQLGDGTLVSKSTPTQVSSLSGITAISAGEHHSLFLKNDGTVWGTGDNYYRQLGDATTTQKSTPIQISSLSGIIAISAGTDHSLFLKNDGTVWGTGANDSGQLGDGTDTERLTPVQASSLSGITAISASQYHSLFLKDDATVWVTGDNDYGQLGTGETTNNSLTTPIQVSSLSGITAISAGYDYSLFLNNDGTVWGTGVNEEGQLGDGTNTNKATPVQALSCTDLSTYSKNIQRSKLDLFPNPVETDLVISVPDYNNSAAEVFDLHGQLLKRVSLKTSKTTIDVSGFPSGTYVIAVKSDKNTAVSKFIKK
jgi:alpha-tubulin suppressor-like RCC1 family protein